mmetsp:Transcript_55199/g.148882  ORF Transcript_55199/g.148882 Transcript_55199/m.148882 type:complete len:217 (+) Transcript_55199:1-651(+)
MQQGEGCALADLGGWLWPPPRARAASLHLQVPFGQLLCGLQAPCAIASAPRRPCLRCLCLSRSRFRSLSGSPAQLLGTAFAAAARPQRRGRHAFPAEAAQSISVKASAAPLTGRFSREGAPRGLAGPAGGPAPPSSSSPLPLLARPSSCPAAAWTRAPGERLRSRCLSLATSASWHLPPSSSPSSFFFRCLSPSWYPKQGTAIRNRTESIYKTRLE